MSEEGCEKDTGAEGARGVAVVVAVAENGPYVLTWDTVDVPVSTPQTTVSLFFGESYSYLPERTSVDPSDVMDSLSETERSTTLKDSEDSQCFCFVREGSNPFLLLVTISGFLYPTSNSGR